jgi:anaerobic magnesium-protoporphyrin IX monomethyl ester cyclase
MTASMKILLVHPPIPRSYYNQEFYIPSSMVYLAAVLQEHGEAVRILDMNTLGLHDRADAMGVYEQRLIQTVEEFRPDLIGFGCLFSGNFPDVLHFAELCKGRFDSIPIISGGIHFTLHAQAILENCPVIDWVALGEAEQTVVELVEALKANQGVDQIPGLAYRDRDRVVLTPRAQYIQDIDQIPLPAYNLIDFSDYAVDTRNWHNPKGLDFQTSIPILSSRSCPNRCTFCSMFMVMGPRWRARTPANVVDEIELLHREYGQNHFSFMDDNFTFDKTRTLAICDDILTRGLDIQFETPNGVSMKTLDAEVIDALVHAGMVRVSLAIESGSEFIRNRIMKKHLTTEKVYEVVDLCKQYQHLYTKAFFIIGMPEETQETLEQTYEMMQRIDVDRIYIQNIIPFSGTAVFEQCAREKLLVNVDTERLYQTDGMYITNYDRFFIKPYALELEDLHRFRQRCDALIKSRKQSV